MEPEKRTEQGIRRVDEEQGEYRSLTTAIVTQTAESGKAIVEGVAIGVGTYLGVKKLSGKNSDEKEN
jgi:hypothetical protein